MNISSKSLFIFSIIFSFCSYSELFGMSKMKYPKGLKEDYRSYEEIAKDKFSIVRKYFNPNLKFCGMTLTQHTYKRKFYTGQGGMIGLDATFYDNNHHDLCKKTKAFLGIVFLSSVVGAGYYFNWFRKK